MDSQAKTPRLLDQVRQVMRLHHCSLHTEPAYVEWMKRYIHFHQMQRREDLGGGEAKIEAFLTDLAVNGHVAPVTQNQALNALVHRRLIWSGSMHAPSLPPSGRQATHPKCE